MTHDLDALEGGPVLRQPVLEEVVDDRVEPLLGRVPRLQQVVVDVGPVDGPDGRLGVGVGRQQYPARLWVQLLGPLQELHPVHLGHAMIGKKHRHGFVALLKLIQNAKRFRTRFSPKHTVIFGILTPQIALDRPQHIGIVIDC